MNVKKPRHIKSECPNPKKNPKNFQKKKAMMATWDALEDSFDEDGEKEANLCLMMNQSESENEKVNTALSHQELEFAFDNLLNDSNTLARKYAFFKAQLSEDQKENEKLKDTNDKLHKANHCLQEFHFELSEQVKLIRKDSSETLTQDTKATSKENKALKERVNELIMIYQDLLKDKKI